MNITDINLIYERIICKCHNCERGDIEEADAIIMDSLYGTFCDVFNKPLDKKKEQLYMSKCDEMAKILSESIDKLEIDADKKQSLKSQLKQADYFTIVFVLGELKSLLY